MDDWTEQPDDDRFQGAHLDPDKYQMDLWKTWRGVPDHAPLPESDEWHRNNDRYNCDQCGELWSSHNLGLSSGIENARCNLCGNEKSWPTSGGPLDSLEQLYKNSSSPDELHVSLALPAHVADEIEAWVKDQDWPRGTELEDRSEYHITLLYAAEGHDKHKEEDWLPKGDRISCEITGLDEFGTEDKKAIVLRLDSPEAALLASDAQDAAERRDVPINRFPGGYKPHITVAYSVRKPPYARAPKLKFKSGPSSVSTPRTSSTDWAAFDNTTGVPCPFCDSMYTTPYKGDRIHCMGCGKTSPAPSLLNMLPVNETPDWGHDDWHFAAQPPPLDWYYHVAPTDARADILAQGLTGHLGDGTNSPWAERRKQWKNRDMNPVDAQQPPGNYLFSDIDDARDYAISDHPNQPGYESQEQADEDLGGHGVGITPAGGFIENQQPDDWDEEAQGDWYDSEDYADEPEVDFDHNNVDHLHRLPHQGFDIWRVNPHGLNVLPDPELASLNGGWMSADEAIDKVRPHAEVGDADPEDPTNYNWPKWNDTDYHGTSPLRWYSPGHVPPENLQHHEWIPPWALNHEEGMGRLEDEPGHVPLDTPEFEREYPQPLHQIHPTALPLTPPPWSVTSAHGLTPCPDCGGDIQHKQGNCQMCGGMGQADRSPYSNQPTGDACPMCHGSGAGESWYQCAGCNRTWDDTNSALSPLMPKGIDCPKCRQPMYWRGSSSLGGMWPKGAWECSNQSCWHMMPPGEQVPDAPPADWS